MESEIELHQDLLSLYPVAASPELFSGLVELRTISSVLGMIAHENTDISLAAVGLIQEITDPELFDEDETAIAVVDEFIKEQGLELIVQNLTRLDETVEEDAQGVYNTLNIIENLVEIRPTLALTVTEKTHIMKFLLTKLNSKSFDANKLYSAELLSILLQADSQNQRRVCSIPDFNGMDSLLQAVNQYRKKSPESAEEEECVEDIFLCLSASLLVPENQARFKSAEGMELMVKILKERKYAAGCAVKVVSYAISDNLSCSEGIIDACGMKYLFPMLININLPKLENRKEKSSGEREHRCALSYNYCG